MRPPAVGIALEGVVVEQSEHLAHVDRHSEQLLVFLEKIDPCIEVAGAVVAVHHGHKRTVRCGHHVDHFVRLRQLFFKNYHREGRCAGADVTGALEHRVGGHHACAGVAFGGDTGGCLRRDGR